MSANVTYHIGPWMNWTKGPIYGGTITLSLRDASILVAFFALFVRLAGSHLWSIFCYLLHQWRSKQGNRDAFHHQHQALLRNSSSVTTTLWLWLKVGWAWRSETFHPMLRSLAFVAMAILHMAAFGIAGLFSSRIVVTDSSVLVRSDVCGAWSISDLLTESNFNNFTEPHDVLIEKESYAINSRQGLTSSLSYARNCYPLESFCEDAKYIVGALNQTYNFNASCPFDESLCVSEGVEIDTGFIDSAIHLGINAKPGDRVLYRKSLSCAVLNDSLHVTEYVGPDPNNTAYPYQKEIFFFYGPDSQGDNFTASFNNYTYDGGYNYWYDLQCFSSLQDFTPIEAFRPEAADIDILFLANKMQYLTRVGDPWFSANTPYNAVFEADTNIPTYLADRLSSPLGCATLHQFCNPNLLPGSACTPWGGLRQTAEILTTQSALKFNDRQNATMVRLLEAAYEASLDQVVISLDQNILLATEEAAKSLTNELPPDQWKSEVTQLNAIMLAYMQSLMVNYVEGPWHPVYNKYIQRPSTPEEEEFCKNQIATDRSKYCFSVLGMAIVLIIGGFIVLLNLTLEPLVRLFRNFRKNDRGLYKQLEWDTTDTLQLQRLVYEGQGTGTWHGEPDVVPVTTYGDRFGIPTWTGVGDARRISQGGASAFEKVDSPLMKGDVRMEVVER